ncbi:MAG: imidazole glycerol phosphate synthase subunit HisH [Oscillospiraceae bacterium]
MIGIIDYGAGNLQSVKNAFEKIGVETEFIASAEQLEQASAIVLPGVGSFGAAMEQLHERNLVAAIRSHAEKNKPLLGICLGLQLLFEESEESPESVGISVFSGKFKRFPEMGLKIPQIGWNNLKIDSESRLFSDNSADEYVYFVHSYYLITCENIVSATTDYGISFPVAVERGNIFACQFHPEKSGEAGLKMLRAFAKTAGEKCRC